MEHNPIVLRDEYAQKQTDKNITPIRNGIEVTLKSFKYSYNHSDKERIEVGFRIFKRLEELREEQSNGH